MKKDVRNNSFEYVIIGAGVSGLSAVGNISKLSDNWVIIDRNLKMPGTTISFDKVKLNIPSAKKKTAGFWLDESQEDGWFGSSNNYSWGRIPVLGGRSNLWSGWSPKIERDNLAQYVQGEVDKNKLGRIYLKTRANLGVKERVTHYTDQRPYLYSAELQENPTFEMLRTSFEQEGIKMTPMPRPGANSYHFIETIPKQITIDNHLIEGTVVNIVNQGDRYRIDLFGNKDELFAEKILLCSSAYESVRLIAQMYINSSRPSGIGENIFDHFYVKTAITFLIDNPEDTNCKAYCYPFQHADSGLEAALQISATKADQDLDGNYVGKITVVGAVPPYSRGSIKFDDSSRDALGRLKPFFDYCYSSKLAKKTDKLVNWLANIIKNNGVKIIAQHSQISRPGESLHEFGGFGREDLLCGGRLSELDSIYICDGSAFSHFGPEHPCVAISSFSNYISSTL